MRRLILGFTLCLLAPKLFAQTTLKGSVRDTAENKALANAVVSLLKKDSSLVAFTRTDKAGGFALNGIAAGTYQILISYPKFADYADEIAVKADAVNLGTVALTPKAQLLQAVIIRNAGAVRIKGDTTEFTADSFAVKAGATVEDLLKKFPGFQVNSKGEITAQGRRVEKVLVDGEEFFGDDPTIATKNLSARAVDKVQLFDNKTDQAQLTGVTTGQEGKTLNIKLKEEAKRGAFGRVEGGTDFNRFSDAKLLANKFRSKEKISVYGTHSTIDGGNLSWGDRRKLGLDNGFEFDEAEGFYMSFNNNDDNVFNSWNIQGLPKATSAGGLYSNKWKDDRQSLNANYRYNRLGVTNNTSLLQQNILPQGITRNRQTGREASLAQQSAGTGRWDWKPDSLTSFKLVVDGQHRKRDGNTQLTTEFTGLTGEVGNTSEQMRSSQTEQMKWTNAFTWKQLFKKAGRQLVATARLNIIDDDQDGVNRSTLRFYSSPSVFRDSVVDQRRAFDGASTTYGLKTTYVEPLSAKTNLIGEYSFNRNVAHSYRNTFNKTADGKYGLRDALFSNNFDMTATVQSGSALIRYTGKKLRFTAGGGASFTTLNLLNIDSSRRDRYPFTNFLPQANVSYSPKQQQGIAIGYRGSTVQPAINQLQPLRDNNDPLRVFVGNPALRVGFNHGLNLNYWQNKTLKQVYLGFGGQFNIINNAITYANSFDAVTGKQTYSPVNVNGNYRFDSWGYYNKGFGENKWSINVQGNFNGSRNVSFVNGAQNVSNNTGLELEPGISRSKENSYEIELSPKIGYNWAKASLQEFSNNYFVYGGSAEGMYMFPGKLRLESDVNWDVQGVIPAFGTRLSIVRWNARLSKGFFKNEAARVAIVANDILNQNVGFTRTLTSSFITENRFDRVARYFLLRLEWSFTKNAAGGGGEQ